MPVRGNRYRTFVRAIAIMRPGNRYVHLEAASSAREAGWRKAEPGAAGHPAGRMTRTLVAGLSRSAFTKLRDGKLAGIREPWNGGLSSGCGIATLSSPALRPLRLPISAYLIDEAVLLETQTQPMSELLGIG